jgi:hypothetical protein
VRSNSGFEVEHESLETLYKVNVRKVMSDFRSSQIIITLLHDLERGGDLEVITHKYVIKTPAKRKEENLFAFSVISINLVL